MLRQAVSLQVMLIWHRNDVEKTTRKTHQYFINFESWIDVELTTSTWCHLFDLDSPFILDELLKNFHCGILDAKSMENR